MSDINASYRKILFSEFQTRKAKNPRYSVRAFAKYLFLDNGFLSKLFSGKVLLSLDLADKITKRLKLTPELRREFLLSAAEEQRCHALYLIDPSLTECEIELHETNLLPRHVADKTVG